MRNLVASLPDVPFRRLRYLGGAFLQFGVRFLGTCVPSRRTRKELIVCRATSLRLVRIGVCIVPKKKVQRSLQLYQVKYKGGTQSARFAIRK